MKEDDAALMSLAEIKAAAVEIAQALRMVGNGPIPAAVRSRLIKIRAGLFQRGIYDPVLVRVDSATVPPAPAAELADELVKVAASL